MTAALFLGGVGIATETQRSGGVPGQEPARLQILAAHGPRGQRLRRPQPGLLLRGDGELFLAAETRRRGEKNQTSGQPLGGRPNIGGCGISKSKWRIRSRKNLMTGADARPTPARSSKPYRPRQVIAWFVNINSISVVKNFSTGKTIPRNCFGTCFDFSNSSLVRSVFPISRSL